MADTNAPERIWIEDERAEGGACHVHNEPTDGVRKYATEYISADLTLAREGALLERAAEVAWTIGVASGEARAEAIRALTSDDATAALAERDERIRREAVKAERERCWEIAKSLNHGAIRHYPKSVEAANAIAAAIRAGGDDD